MARIVAAALAAYSFFLIQSSLPHLPARIPTHFDMAGQPNGWGSPHTLWVLLFFQVLVTGVMLSIPFWGRRFPRSVHLGTRSLGDYTPEQRERVWPLIDQMAGWMGAATSLFFVCLIREATRAAQSPNPHFRMGWLPFIYVGGLAGVAIYFVAVWARAWRWHYLLRPIKKIPTSTMFPVVAIGYMGNNIYPARAGEVLRAVDGSFSETGCLRGQLDDSYSCPEAGSCGLRQLWGNVRETVDKLLFETTFAEVCRRTNPKSMASGETLGITPGV